MEEIHPLRKYRHSQTPRLSQKVLADRVGKDRVTVHRWETGKRKPEGEDLELLSKVTGIPKRALRPDLVEMLGDAA